VHPADPLGSLTPAEVPLIEAEKLSEQAGPPQPADQLVQYPTKYQLVINPTAAKAINLDVSPALLSVADEVIE
jgi:hypothetical protein